MKPLEVPARWDRDSRSVAFDLPTSDGTAHRTVIYFPDRVVDNDVLDTVSTSLAQGENALIVAVEGATYGAINRGRFLHDPCAIIEPGLLVEMIARLYTRNATASLDATGADILDELFGTPTPPGIDAAAAQVELAHLLWNNAPLLTRTDLENRLAFFDLVASDLPE